VGELVRAEAVKVEIARVESVAPIKGIGFCTSVSAPIRIQVPRSKVTSVASRFVLAARLRVADTLFDAASASQAFCDWHLGFSTSLG
jgi:hypothetical protein